MITAHRLPWLVGAAFLILYAATTAPSIVELFDDTLEFQLVGPTFGIAHPTGYPLYVLLGGVWSRLLLPVGNWAWRMNLFSALAAAAAVGLTCRAAQQLTTDARGRVPWAPGIAAALALGVSPLWWSQATVAEVYALHGLFVASILTVAIRILHDMPARRAEPPARLVILLCVLFGLALTHHRTALLLALPVAMVLVWRYPSMARPQPAWLVWSLALLAPLLLYLLIPLRAMMGVRDLNGSYVHTWAGFWDHVLARQYAGFFADNPLAVERSAADWWRRWVDESGFIGLSMGLVGLTQLVGPARRLRMDWFLVLLVLMVNLLFAVNYRVHDAEVFLLPSLLAFALFVGGGMGRVTGAGEQRLRGPYVTAVLVVILSLIALRGPIINRSQNWAAHDYAVALAKTDFPPGSWVVALEGEATALRYMQQAEGLGRNATPIVANDVALRRATVAERVAKGVPVYLTRELEGISTLYSFSGDGVLVRVWPRGRAVVGEPAHPVDAPFAEGRLRLEGYDLDKLEQAGGPALRVALYWRPQTDLTQRLKLSLRLHSPDGAPVLWPRGEPVQEDFFPLRLVAPTTDWVPGERIRDVYHLPIPADAVTRPAQLVVIAYDADTLAEAGRWSIAVGW